MQIVGEFCLLFIVCSVLNCYKRFLEYFLGFLLMDCVSCLKCLSSNCDFGCGLLVFGCFKPVFNALGLFLLFGLGLKVLQYGFHCKGLGHFLCDFRGKSSEFRNGFCSENCFDRKCNSKILSCKRGLLKFLKSSNPPMIRKLEETKEIFNGSNSNDDAEVKTSSKEEYDDDDDNKKDCYNEYEDEVDVMALRKMIKIERHRANVTYLELEKERMAAATAAEEAMAMILRLQNEKSLIEMEANQYRRLAEEKQLHDQEVIQSLQWIVMKHESERSLLEDQLRMCRTKVDDGDQFEEVDDSLRFSKANIEDAFHDGLISSLDMDLLT